MQVELEVGEVIRLSSILQAVMLTFIFLASVLYSESSIELHRADRHGFGEKVIKARSKVVIMTLTVGTLMLFTFANHCYGQVGLLQCFYISPGQQLMRNMAIAVFINTTLFLGGIHQELYNGKIKKKILRFYRKQFQWGLFKKLFVVPLFVELVYRAMFCRIVDPQMHHSSFFTFFAGSLYGFSHLINVFRFQHKHGLEFSLKTTGIQVIYNLIFGLYVSFIFSKSLALMSSLVLHVYANFMGFPQYFEIFKGGQSTDDRVRKSTIFYVFGVAGCLSCCLFL